LAYDVPRGGSGATIQATIDQAIAENNGKRPVVHIPSGQYSVTATITIPGNSDVQIIGDNMQTIINWSGSTSSPVLALLPPSHAEIRNLAINASSSSAGILHWLQPSGRLLKWDSKPQARPDQTLKVISIFPLALEEIGGCRPLVQT
jgi:hypothetical protein